MFLQTAVQTLPHQIARFLFSRFVRGALWLVFLVALSGFVLEALGTLCPAVPRALLRHVNTHFLERSVFLYPDGRAFHVRILDSKPVYYEVPAE